MHPFPPPTARLAGAAAALLGALALAPLHAQERPADTRAPLVEVERAGERPAGATQDFVARVTDDRALENVTLYHRREGESAYGRAPMRPLGAGDRFGATLPTDPDDLRPIEYYVQALDGTGNRTVSGFAFDPLRRLLRAAPGALAGGPPPVTAEPDARVPEPDAGGTRWWAVALGVLAVGAVAALANGGDDGGGSDDATGTVPLTVDLPEPVTR